MSLKASAPSFIPGQSFSLNSSAPSFLPNRSSSDRNSSTRSISRRSSSRGVGPTDYDVQKKVMGRYILKDDLNDLEDDKDILESKIERNKLKRETRLADELKRIPSRENRIARGREEQRLRHRRARTKRSMRYMRNLPEDQRQGNIRDRVEAMTDAEQEEIIEDLGSEDYNDVLESGSSDEDLDSDNEDDMKLKENRRRDLDYYREQDQLDMEEEGPIMNDEMEFDELEDKLNEMKRMDPIRCKRVRQMVEADPMLYNDKQFYEMYIKPCKDETTEVYIDTFFNINWQWIKPIGIRPIAPTNRNDIDITWGNMNNFNKARDRFKIEEAINKIPAKYYPRSSKTALIDCLIELDLLSSSNRDSDLGPPFYNIDVLAYFFKLVPETERQTIQLRHLKYNNYNQKYRIQSRGLSGKEELERLLNLFEETVLSRELKQQVTIDGRKRSILIDAEKIEQMKRYFILMLIGVVQNPTYIEQLVLLRFAMPVNNSRGYTREDVTLQDDIKKLDDWIEGVDEFF